MYQIIRSDRKTIAIQIKPDGQVIVRAPRRMPRAAIDAFAQSKKDWILQHVQLALQKQPPSGSFSTEELRRLAEAAKKDLPLRAARLAALAGVSYGKITIRAQKTRWGSCSSKGNLNFNCLLMLCPETVRDYVVAHELCHLKEMNHSARFWKLVDGIIPDVAAQQKWLKANGSDLVCRLP